jgi:hypothetical protein
MTPEETQARLDICKLCESFIIEESGTRCAECVGGCSIGRLISHEEETCPKGKW